MVEKSGILKNTKELTPEVASNIVRNNVFAASDMIRVARETYFKGLQACDIEGNENSCHYAIICLINHSCLNNVKFFFVGNVIFVMAYRDIKKGEEILDCYYPQTQTIGHRQVFYKALGFTCTCSLCN